VANLVKSLKRGILEKRNPKSDNTQGFQSARRMITSYRIVTMTTHFGNVDHLGTPHNIAEASIVLSTEDATVEMTYSSDDSLEKNDILPLCRWRIDNF
jgi:hypothetical protein